MNLVVISILKMNIFVIYVVEMNIILISILEMNIVVIFFNRGSTVTFPLVQFIVHLSLICAILRKDCAFLVK